MAKQDGRYRLPVDVIRVNDEYRRAVLYAVGNTVVCDSLDVAREICFSHMSGSGSGEDQLKAVTMGGAGKYLQWLRKKQYANSTDD